MEGTSFTLKSIDLRQLRLHNQEMTTTRALDAAAVSLVEEIDERAGWSWSGDGERCGIL